LRAGEADIRDFDGRPGKFEKIFEISGTEFGVREMGDSRRYALGVCERLERGGDGVQHVSGIGRETVVEWNFAGDEGANFFVGSEGEIIECAAAEVYGLFDLEFAGDACANGAVGISDFVKGTGGGEGLRRRLQMRWVEW